MAGPKYWPVTLNGVTYQESDFLGNAYVIGFPAALHDFVMHAASLWTATSGSAVSIGAGIKNFSTQAGKPWLPGSPMRISATVDPVGAWMDAVVTSYNPDTGALTVNVVGFSGSGSFNSWNINAGGGGYGVSGTLPIAQGGTGATNATAGLAALGGVPLGRTVTAGFGLSGGGSLASDIALAFASEELGIATPDINADFLLFHDFSDNVARRVLISQFRDALLPPGTIAPFAGPVEPPGWFFCDGRSLSRTTYSALFAAIGTIYGFNDVNTFKIPDARGRAIFGKDNMGGFSAGRITLAGCGIDGDTLGATGGDQRMQSHTHQFSATTSSSGTHAHQLPQSYLSGGSNPIGAGGSTPFGSPTSTQSAGAHIHTVSGTTGASGSGGYQNMPPAILHNIMIKY